MKQHVHLLPAARQRVLTYAGVLAATLSLAACGGGGSAGPAPSTANVLPGAGAGAGAGSGNSSAAATNATGSMSITVPARSTTSSVRTPAYISASTQSMTIATVPASGTPTQIAEADLTPTSAGCAAVTGGGTQCTVTFGAPAGQSAPLLVNTYDAVGGKGNLLSSATLQATLTASKTNTIPVVLNGVATTAAVILGSSSMPVGAAGTTSVAIQANDAGGNAIIGPGSFANPITVTVTGDTWNTVAPSSFTISAPGQVKTLAYSGASLAGATLTPSGSGLTGTPATFAGSGVAVSWYQGTYYSANGEYYLYPYGIAAIPNGTAAVLFDAEIYPTVGSDVYQYIIGIVNPTSVQTLYAGDTSDPFNPPAAGLLTIPGVTVVNGMSNNLEDDEVSDSYREIAADSKGQVYYVGDYSSTSDPNCPGGTSYSGLIGILNPAGPSAHQIPLKVYPYQIRVDSSGNIWFTGSSGSCSGGANSGSYFPNTYVAGEISAGGVITQKTFVSMGLPDDEPYDMDITPAGDTMAIADYNNSHIFKIATASWAPQTVTPAISYDPLTVAVAPDGTVAWFSDNDPEESYYWGFVRGSSAFSTANIVDQTFPQFYFYSYSMNYGDGSFWVAGSDYGTGFGRLANVAGTATTPATGAPVQGYVSLPYPDGSGSELYGVSEANGTVWAFDDEYYNIVSMQYGAAKAGILNPASVKVKHAGTLVKLVAPKIPSSVRRDPKTSTHRGSGAK